MQLLNVTLKSRPHEPELVGFEKLLTKTLKCISRSVFEQNRNFFLLIRLEINFVDVLGTIYVKKFFIVAPTQEAVEGGSFFAFSLVILFRPTL